MIRSLSKMLILRKRTTEIKKDSTKKVIKMKAIKSIETSQIRRSFRRKEKEVSIRDLAEFRRLRVNENK